MTDSNPSDLPARCDLSSVPTLTESLLEQDWKTEKGEEHSMTEADPVKASTLGTSSQKSEQAGNDTDDEAHKLNPTMQCPEGTEVGRESMAKKSGSGETTELSSLPKGQNASDSMDRTATCKESMLAETANSGEEAKEETKYWRWEEWHAKTKAENPNTTTHERSVEVLDANEGTKNNHTISKMSKQELEKSIEELDDLVERWRQTSGMYTVMEELKKNAHRNALSNSDRDGTSYIDVSDLILTLSNGIEEGANESVTAVLETTVVAALLMTFSVMLLVCPPDAIADLDHYDWKKILHSIGWTVMSAIGAGIIMYARLYTGAVSRAVRASDKLRIQMRGNSHQVTFYKMLVMFVFFGLGILADCAALYGTLAGVLITLFFYAAVGHCSYLAYPFLLEGHIQFGWTAHHQSRNDPMDDKLLFELLRQRAEYAKRLRDEAESIFVYERPKGKEHSFDVLGPKCVSEKGKEFLNEFDGDDWTEKVYGHELS